MPEINQFDHVSVVFDNYALRGAHDIIVRKDGIAFVAGKFASFGIIDVREPLSPKIRGYLADMPYYNEAQTVYLKNDYCFLGGNWFMSIDVSNIDNPEIKKRIESPEIHEINGVAEYENYLFAASKNGYINLFDIRDETDPVFLGSFNVLANAGITKPHDVAIYKEEYCLIVNGANLGKASPNKVAIYRCIDKEKRKPLPFGKWELLSYCDDEEAEGANRVLVKEEYAYVACNNSCRIMIYDISNPNCISKVTSFNTTGVCPDGIRIDGDILYIGAEDTVQVVSIKDPYNPVTISDRRYPQVFPSNASHKNLTLKMASNAHDLDIYNGYIFVTGQFDNCVGVIKI